MGNLHENSSDSTILNEGLAQLGLASEKDKFLFFVQDKETYSYKPALWFQLEKAEFYQANAVFFKKGIREDELIPQIYIYDYTSFPLANKDLLTEIHKNVWTGGEIPIVCVFSKTEVIILDTTKPVQEHKGDFSPAYLVENLKDVASVNKHIYNNLAHLLKSGAYWDMANVDFYKTSSYIQLTSLLRKVINKFTVESGLAGRKDIVQKLIIQCILVKYLEERRDENNNTVFPTSFFENYGGAQQFSDILINGQLFNFFDYLNKDHFNGGIFRWDDKDKLLLDGKQEAFNYLADVLRGYIDTNDQHILEFPDNFSRLYSFNHIPVELISRLYEEFIIKENKKRKLEADEEGSRKIKNDGVAYTPSHLVKLLVNEAMPLNEVPDDLGNFKVLDPACGSAIFLVVAFKRLVQWWRQKNEYKNPKLDDLITLLNAVYGVDSDPKAVQISVFSLSIALCDELSPKEIWEDLEFENLEGKQIYHKDFFDWKKEIPRDLLFDVVIGNPPFVRGGINKNMNKWTINETQVVNIPRNQIALKFLSESLALLKNNGLCCLIVKALPLLYSNSEVSKAYLKALTLNYHINQIFDFTPLARNKSLWDGSEKAADVSAVAIFITNSKPDFSRNILHAIFRRTKVNTERIYFEIDKYDLHFVLRNEIYEKDSFIFKINLMGGGRLKNLVYKLRLYPLLKDYEERGICILREGHGTLSKNVKNAPLTNKRINSRRGVVNGSVVATEYISEEERIKIIDSPVYYAPTLVISETLDLETKSITKALTSENLIFKNRYIGIHSFDIETFPLSGLYERLILNEATYIVYLLSTSAQIYVNLNTSIYCEDLRELPIIAKDFTLTSQDRNILQDTLEYLDDFIRHKNSKALNQISRKKICETISFYGQEFSNTINELYADGINTFKLTDIIYFEKENLIGALFSYDNEKNDKPNVIRENEVTQIEGLVNFDINESLTATRIIQYYAPNKVLFVKPNQKRYWLASIAYRDADSVFADILNNK